MQGRRQRHHGVEADVVLAAKGAGVRERGGGDELRQSGPGIEFVSELGQEFVRGCLLHEPHQRLERAEVEWVGRVGGERRGKAKLAGHAAAEGGHEHAAADTSQEFTAGLGGIPLVLDGSRRWGHNILVVLMRGGVKWLACSGSAVPPALCQGIAGAAIWPGDQPGRWSCRSSGIAQGRGVGRGRRGGVGTGKLFG